MVSPSHLKLVPVNEPSFVEFELGSSFNELSLVIYQTILFNRVEPPLASLVEQAEIH